MKLRIVPPIFGLICALMMLGIAKFLPPANLLFPGQKIIAALIIVIGLLLDIIAVIQFRKHITTISPFNPEKTVSIVTNGVFAISRNPMYLGMLFIMMGIGILLGNPMNIIILIGFVAIITIFQIKPEEEILEAKFGHDYLAYCGNVRRWI